jgi:hypothetical protein
MHEVEGVSTTQVMKPMVKLQGVVPLKSHMNAKPKLQPLREISMNVTRVISLLFMAWRHDDIARAAQSV